MSDQVAVIGSLVLVGGCIAIVAFVTNTYRKSKAFADAAIASEPGASLELVCGIRLGLFNATWPAGRCRLTEQGIGLSCLGFATHASWIDIKTVELVKPMNLVGWGVRFRIPSMHPDSAIVWLGSQRLAERLIESCKFHQVPTELKPRVVL